MCNNCLFRCKDQNYYPSHPPSVAPSFNPSARDFFAGEIRIQNGCESWRRSTLQERLVWRLCSVIITTDGFRSYCSSCGYGLLLCASRAKAKSRITRETLRGCSVQNLERWSVSEDLCELFDQMFLWIVYSFCSLAFFNSGDSIRSRALTVILM